MESKQFNTYLNVIRSGDIKGLESIYNDYYVAMIAIAIKITKSYYLAKEVVDDFLRFIYVESNRIPFIENPNSWIEAEIENWACGHLIARIDKMKIENLPKNTEFQKAFVECFETLTKEERPIVILRLGLNYPYKLITKIVNKPIPELKDIIDTILLRLSGLRE